MLLNLHVKDIALIRDVRISFEDGLNILTGETGAGKSILIGSVLLALGAKAKSDLIRRGASEGFVELLFDVREKEKAEALEKLGFSPEDGLIAISRRLSAQRSVSRINGEVVTRARLREVSELLLDLYGQNEQQTLLNPARHLQILDDYLHASIGEAKERVRHAYAAYREALSALSAFSLDEKERMRELEFASFEVDEIEAADIQPGEEEALSALYRKMSHAKEVLQAVSEAYGALSESPVQRAVSLLSEVLSYDESLKQVYDELCDAESILEGAERTLSSYADDADLNEQRFRETEERLDLIRSLQAKYGNTVEEILAYKELRAARIEQLSDYEEKKKAAEENKERLKKELLEACEALSAQRKAGAKKLCAAIREELLSLNFSAVQMELCFTRTEPADNGFDAAEFHASLNPGEQAKPLAEVASGGELSRVMLAIKTVLAETDHIPTLIFDEVDAGISGRTAQQVSEKLSLIAKTHQVLCITHLPQIAAMADAHYRIEKEEQDGRNETSVTRLEEGACLEELARLLGGVEITDAVRENAAEMRRLAAEKKQKSHK